MQRFQRRTAWAMVLLSGTLLVLGIGYVAYLLMAAPHHLRGAHHTSIRLQSWDTTAPEAAFLIGLVCLALAGLVAHGLVVLRRKRKRV